MTNNPVTAASDQRVSVMVRCLAKAIDFSVIFFLNAIFPIVVGALLGFVYTLIHDGLMQGQSVGKKVFKLKTRAIHGDKPCTYRESALRNAPLGIATFFAIIPFWGWILLVLVGVPLIAIEIYLMYTRADGYRLGDIMADTRVVLAEHEKADR